MTHTPNPDPPSDPILQVDADGTPLHVGDRVESLTGFGPGGGVIEEVRSTGVVVVGGPEVSARYLRLVRESRTPNPDPPSDLDRTFVKGQWVEVIDETEHSFGMKGTIAWTPEEAWSDWAEEMVEGFDPLAYDGDGSDLEFRAVDIYTIWIDGLEVNYDCLSAYQLAVYKPKG